MTTRRQRIAQIKAELCNIPGEPCGMPLHQCDNPGHSRYWWLSVELFDLEHNLPRSTWPQPLPRRDCLRAGMVCLLLALALAGLCLLCGCATVPKGRPALPGEPVLPWYRIG